MSGPNPVQRTVFATPRAAEFLELNALQAQTGQPSEAFGHVVVKELLDNALDAAESAGVAPVIGIDARTDDDNEITFVTVTDNGAGITPDTVTDVCDFAVLASDKARYRGPSRGAQGNALKTLLGIPHALGVDAPVVIDSAGVRHVLRVSVDAAGEVVVEHTTGPGRSSGTAVTVPLPEDLDVDVERWAYAAALVNPHATISAIDQAYGDDEPDTELYESAGQGHFSKWTPNRPSNPHWYTPTAFAALVASYNRTRNRPLAEFLDEFEGLRGRAKQKAIRRALPGITHLAQLAGHDDLVAALHAAMRAEAKTTPLSRLGAVGQKHLEAVLDNAYGVQRLWYKPVALTDHNKVPWLIEVAVADTDEPGGVWYGVNHGAAFDDPLGRTWLYADRVGDRIGGYGADPFLARAGIRNFDGAGVAVVHVVCAASQFMDKGKVALVVPDEVAQAAAETLADATKTLRREEEQRTQNAAKAERAAQRRRDEANRAERETRWTQKAAVFNVMAEAKAAAGLICMVRTLFYKVRPLIQRYTKKELGYSYFSQTLVPDYQRIVGAMEGLYYKARGELHHPHDGQMLKLGTREVAAYIPPNWQYDKILYIEKEGLGPQLEPYQLGQRFDMAIILGEGYPVTACRDLLARFESHIHDVTIFALHDADINGYDIARVLAEATRRMPEHHVQVIDLGLTVPQAIDAGLETESFTRRKALPEDLELDDDARAWFTGQPVAAGWGKTHYTCTRCELNAFTADELAEFIEDRLAAHGATTKLVAPADVLAEHVDAVRQEALTEMVTEELHRMINIDAMVRRLLDGTEFADIEEAEVRERFIDEPAESWRAAAEQLVSADIDGIDGLLNDVRALLAERLRDDTN